MNEEVCRCGHVKSAHLVGGYGWPVSYRSCVADGLELYTEPAGVIHDCKVYRVSFGKTVEYNGEGTP